MPLPSQHNKRYGHLNVSVNTREQIKADGAPDNVVKAYTEMDKKHHPISNTFHHTGDPYDDKKWRQTIDLANPKPSEAPNWPKMTELVRQALAYSKTVDDYYQENETRQAVLACDSILKAIAVKDWQDAWYHKTAYMDAIVLFSHKHWDARTAGAAQKEWGRFVGEEPRNKWVVTIFPETYLPKDAPSVEEPLPPVVAPDLSLAEKIDSNSKKLDLIIELLSKKTEAVTAPQTPENPVTPGVKPTQSLPFALQKRGETPKLIQKPNEVIDVTDLGLGSNKEPNHPSFEVFNKTGTHGIFGSAKAIINLQTKETIANIAGSGNVMWSRVEPSVIYAVLNSGLGIDRYSNYGKIREPFITARQLGFTQLETKSEGPFISNDDAFLFCRATSTSGAKFMVFIDMSAKEVVKQWPVEDTNFDCWGIDPVGQHGVLDTLPASTENGKWRIYDQVFNEVYETAAIGTKHFTTTEGLLTDVNGVTVDLATGKHSKPLAGLGHGVSNAQHINAMNNINALVWTQGSKGASKKQIDLVSLDGQSFAYLMETSGGVYGGEIYASGNFYNGVFKLAYVEGNRTKVAVWR